MKRHIAPTSLVVGFCMLALVAFVPELLGQEKANEAVWHRYSTSAGDLTFAFPNKNVLVDQNDSKTSIYFSEIGLYLSVRAERMKGAKNRFLELSRLPSAEEYKGFKLDDLYGRWRRDTNKVKGTDSVFFELASKSGFYRIAARSRDGRDSDLERFLRSIRVNGSQLINTQISEEPEEKSVTMIESLPISDKVVEALKRSTPDKLSYTRPSKRDKSTEIENGDDTSDEPPRKYSSDTIILRNPFPRRDESGRAIRLPRVVKFRATFRADGTIGPVELLQSIDKGYDDLAFEALIGIKFIPAEIDGKPVDVVRIIEYSFGRY